MKNTKSSTTILYDPINETEWYKVRLMMNNLYLYYAKFYIFNSSMNHFFMRYFLYALEKRENDLQLNVIIVTHTTRKK